MMVYHFCSKDASLPLKRQRVQRRKITPYSCVESFFPTGDREKDLLTLKNTIFNASLKGAPNESDTPPVKKRRALNRRQPARDP